VLKDRVEAAQGDLDPAVTFNSQAEGLARL
jgi:hypothetical protein